MGAYARRKKSPMNTHPDFDTPRVAPASSPVREALAELENRVREMTAKGTNQITAGAPGEAALYESTIDGILVRELPADPLCLRISIGSPTSELANQGVASYCVFRGDRSDVIALLERSLAALKA